VVATGGQDRSGAGRGGAAGGPGVVYVRLYPGSAAPDPGRWIREVRGVPAWSGVSVASSRAASRCWRRAAGPGQAPRSVRV